MNHLPDRRRIHIARHIDLGNILAIVVALVLGSNWAGDKIAKIATKNATVAAQILALQNRIETLEGLHLDTGNE